MAETENEMRTALDKFVTRHPELAKDPDLGNTGFTVLARHIVEDLKRAGITEDAIAPHRNDVRYLAHAAAALKRGGHRVRSFDELLDATGNTMASKFGLKRGSPAYGSRSGIQGDYQSRIDRKRAMPSQPRPAGVRMAAPERPRPKTSEEIVAETRRARGFPASGR
jgi:hypothetical protein